MSRALTIQRTTVTPPERDRFFEKSKRKQEYYTKANCRFWVFEELGLPGAFLEFVEASDPQTLAKALANAPDQLLDPKRIYAEVELK
jgi:hypothetical protein